MSHESHVIVVFPPAAGGNHLRNLIDTSLDKNYLLNLYSQYRKSVHASLGNNFDKDRLLVEKITHGHFGEIMSHQNLIRQLSQNLKLIILSPDTMADRQLLNARCQKLHGKGAFELGDYFDGEQVFLYEPFMYHYYFGIDMNNIMNISISEWFVSEISPVLDRISIFLNKNLDKDFCLHLHNLWFNKNLGIINV